MSTFKQYWSHGVPVVVVNVPISSDFNPGYFITKYGTDIVNVVNCDDPDDWKETCVTQFLTDWGQSLDPDDPTKIWKLKVRFLRI